VAGARQNPASHAALSLCGLRLRERGAFLAVPGLSQLGCLCAGRPAGCDTGRARPVGKADSLRPRQVHFSANCNFFMFPRAPFVRSLSVATGERLSSDIHQPAKERRMSTNGRNARLVRRSVQMLIASLLPVMAWAGPVDINKADAATIA